MDIDPAQPWGIAIDYFGRATLTEDGHTVQIRVFDQTLGGPLTADAGTGRYPSVWVGAQITESGESGGAELYGSGQVVLEPAGTGPVTPDPTAVPAAVAAALADFRARTAAYAALCAAWPAPQPPTEPAPEPAPEQQP
jgi:hypothetical protein